MKPISGFIVTTSISIRLSAVYVSHPDSGLIRRFTGLSEKDDTNSSGAVKNPQPEFKGSRESSAGKRCVEKRDAPYKLLTGRVRSVFERTTSRQPQTKKAPEETVFRG